MGFSKSGEKDEIEIQSEQDKKQRVLIEAHAVASSPVSELILRTLRANNKRFQFQGIADKPGYMEVTSNGKMYRVYVDIVKSDYMLDMTPFEHAKNKDYLLLQLSKFMLYCETIFKVLMETVVKDFPEFTNWKLNLDKEKSTMYISPEHTKRIGFVIQTLKTIPPTNSQPSQPISESSTSNSQPSRPISESSTSNST